MAVRKFKPTTPGQRHKVIGVFKGTITARTPEKSLTVGRKASGGRNSEGHLTTRYLGGGHKRIFTVNRSTFVNKKSREQFQLSSFKRLIDIYNSTAKTVDALMKLELPSGVQVEVKV